MSDLKSVKMSVVVEVDVTDAESVASAREAAFELAKPLLSSKRGRKSSGPRAIVTGIRVVQDSAGESVLPNASDALESGA